jgi:hypothetical protein
MVLTAEILCNQRIIYSGATLPSTGTGLGSTKAFALRGRRLTARAIAEMRLQKYKHDSRNAKHYNFSCHETNVSLQSTFALQKLTVGPETHLF